MAMQTGSTASQPALSIGQQWRWHSAETPAPSSLLQGVVSAFTDWLPKLRDGILLATAVDEPVQQASDVNRTRRIYALLKAAECGSRKGCDPYGAPCVHAAVCGG